VRELSHTDSLFWCAASVGILRGGCILRNMQRIIQFVAISALTLLSISAFAQGNSSATLLVISKKDHTVAIVDPATLKVGARVPVGDDPHEVVASADGRTAWVSNYGSGTLNTLSVIDLVNGKALPPVDLGLLRGVHGMTFVGGKLWFTAEGAKVIGRYDPATGKVDWMMGTGQDRTHMIWVSPDQQRIVTTNVRSGTVSLMERIAVPRGTPPPNAPPQYQPPPDDGKEWTETVVKVGRNSEGFDLSPDRKEIWVANGGDGTISVIDYAAKKVVATLDVNLKGANRLKFSTDGKRVLVSTLEGKDLLVLDVATRKEIKRVPIGAEAAGIEMEPNGKRAFVSATFGSYVAVIDMETLTVTGKINVGGFPDGTAWAVLTK
jgi:YVTN family beta-propeller protein